MLLKLLLKLLYWDLFNGERERERERQRERERERESEREREREGGEGGGGGGGRQTDRRKAFWRIYLQQLKKILKCSLAFLVDTPV